MPGCWQDWDGLEWVAARSEEGLQETLARSTPQEVGAFQLLCKTSGCQVRSTDVAYAIPASSSSPSAPSSSAVPHSSNMEIVYQHVHFWSPVVFLTSIGRLFPHPLPVLCTHIEPPQCDRIQTNYFNIFLISNHIPPDILLGCFAEIVFFYMFMH